MNRRVLRVGVPVAALAIIAIQFVQPDRTNPPHDAAASFEAVVKPSPELAAVIRNSCQDCHSNQTTWPWYSRIAPVSWLVASDVQEGRTKLNFSEWSRYSPEASQIKLRQMCTEVREGDMPPLQYTLMHPGSKLGDKEIATICQTPGT